MVKSGECINSQNVNYTCWERDDTKEINSEIRAQLNYLIKIYLYLYDPVFYLLNGPVYPWKLMDLLVLTMLSSILFMFNMNFTKDFCVKL